METKNTEMEKDIFLFFLEYILNDSSIFRLLAFLFEKKNIHNEIKILSMNELKNEFKDWSLSHLKTKLLFLKNLNLINTDATINENTKRAISLYSLSKYGAYVYLTCLRLKRNQEEK